MTHKLIYTTYIYNMDGNIHKSEALKSNSNTCKESKLVKENINSTYCKFV